MKSKESTRICKACFKEIKSNSLFSFLHTDVYLCPECQKEYEPVFIRFKLGKIKCTSIYYYDEKIKETLFNLKGCYDIEMAPVFLSQFIDILKVRYLGYLLLPAPSSKKDDENREFNHVEEIFKLFKFPYVKCIGKIDDYKQSDQSQKDRENIKKHLFISGGEILSNKKVLIVDDVFTTGNTVKAMIKMVSKFSPKKIEVLTVAKTMDLDEQKKKKQTYKSKIHDFVHRLN